MAEEYDGGTQDESNEELDIEGFIDTGIDSTRVLTESTSTLISMAGSNFNALTKLFTQMVDMIENELLKEHKHVHLFHKHRSCQGHCNSVKLTLEMLLGSAIFVMSGGKFFANGHQNTLVNLLLNEMVHHKDLDDNGKVFFHDFIFDWDDRNIPPAIKQLQNNPFMPGATLHPHTSEDYIIAFNEYLIDYLNNFDEIKQGKPRKPKLMKRSKTCTVISWNEYYSNINEYYKQYLVI